MIYTAPRQGLFAILMLTSFLLHAVLLLVSTSGQLEALQQQTAQRVLSQLGEEIKLPLLSRDEVSLGVLAGRYVSESDIANISISDIDEEVLLSTGQSQLSTGEVMTQPVVIEGTKVGTVAVTLKPISNGEILTTQWQFLVGSLLVHVLLWLAYGHVARPTKTQLAKLSQDVQEYLISQDRIRSKQTRTDEDAERFAEQDESERKSAGILSHLMPDKKADNQSTNPNTELDPDVQQATSTATDTLDIAPKRPNHISDIAHGKAQDSLPNQFDQSDRMAEKFNIHEALSEYVQTHQGQTDDDSDLDDAPNQTSEPQQTSHLHQSPTNTSFKTTDATGATVSMTENKIADPYAAREDSGKIKKQSLPNQSSSNQSSINASINSSINKGILSANRPLDGVQLHIQFVDKHNLLAKLAPTPAQLYLTLCQQVLERVQDTLLQQFGWQHIAFHQLTAFDAEGADVLLTCERQGADKDNQLALAGMMLAKAMLMVNQVVCKSSHDLKRFALPMQVGVSDVMSAKFMDNLLDYHGKENAILALLPQAGITQLKGHVQLDDLIDPITIYERDCAVLAGVSDKMMSQLVQVRQAVLLPEDSNE